MKITQNQLIELLSEIKGVTMTNITYFVDEHKSRIVDSKRVVQKQVTVNVTLNSVYERRVKKRDNEFETGELFGKKMITPSLVLSLKDNEYMLYGVIERGAKSSVKYFYKGEERDIEDLIKLNLFQPAFFNKKPKENEFTIILPKIKSIQKIKIKGITYEITNETA